MESKLKAQIDPSWQSVLQAEFKQNYFIELTHYLAQRRKEGAIIYPPEALIFNAFNATPLDAVKVVILGQDPYHGAGEAHGLCFSVQRGIRIPPSLRNIYKELHADTGTNVPLHGQLTAWSKAGVFLLNTILTVEHKSPASHRNKGWETFTDSVIQTLSTERDHLVFILWGAYARSKRSLINEKKHCILEAAHPAAEVYAGGKAGFFGSKPFSLANTYLQRHGVEAVDWNIPF